MRRRNRGILTGINKLTNEPLYLEPKAYAHGVYVAGRIGDGKSQYLSGVAVQLPAHGVRVFFIVQKADTWMVNWAKHCGFDPILITLSPGKRTLSLPFFEMIYDAVRDWDKVGDVAERILTGTGSKGQYPVGFFTRMNKTAINLALQGEQPSVTPEKVADKIDKLIKNNPDQYKHATHIAAELRGLKPCKLLHRQPGVEVLSIGDFLQNGGFVVAALDQVGEEGHSDVVAKLLDECVNQHRIRRRALGYHEQVAIILDDGGSAAESGVIAKRISVMRFAGVSTFFSGQLPEEQGKGPKGGQNPGTLLRQMTGLQAYFSGDVNLIKEALYLSGEITTWDEGMSRSTSPSTFGVRESDSQSWHSRIRTRLSINDWLELIEPPFHFLLCRPGHPPTPMRLAMLTESEEEYDRIERQPWPDAPKAAPTTTTPPTTPTPNPTTVDPNAAREQAVNNLKQKRRKK